MTLRKKFGIVGFVFGVVVALSLGEIASNQSMSFMLIVALWPTAIFGIGATGWSDGVIFHIIQMLLVFGGNGVVYGLVLSFIGAAIQSRKSK